MMSDSDEESPCSLVLLQASEAFPKKSLHRDEESLQVPFIALHGESVIYLGCTGEGTIALSDFRLLIKYKDSFVNIPLGLIEVIECRDIFYLYVFCKDARSVRCVFSTNEGCLEFYKRLSSVLNPPQKYEDIFACAFYAWCNDPAVQGSEYDTLSMKEYCSPYQLGDEMERMGFKVKEIWRIYNSNEKYLICPSYPKEHIVPAWITDQEIESAASFRSSKRFPSVVWRYQKNGMVIARCSQPEVGWLGWRNKEDETLLQAIATACHLDKKGSKSLAKEETDSNSNVRKASKDIKSKVLIIDARSYTAALANRAKGGGMECADYYPDCEIIFMNLANIHAIRKSFHALRALCASNTDQISWMSSLEATKWLHNISALMKAANTAVSAVDKEERPVVVHCSDGWDRTPQIVALAEIMLDPYYRTIQGFQVLIEREWLSFGHKFGDRCSHGVKSDDTSERCPVFLQWLDSVHQLLLQFTCAFEFNEMFLVKLAQHVYSCLFGTFLCNNEREREKARINKITFSVWTLLHSEANRYKNLLYSYDDQVLRPATHIRNIKLWSNMYLSSTCSTSGEEQTIDVQPVTVKDPEPVLLPKTRSCDDIIAALENEVTPAPRRLSDPTIEGLDANYLISVQAKGSPIMTEHHVTMSGSHDDITHAAIMNGVYDSTADSTSQKQTEEIELEAMGSSKHDGIDHATLSSGTLCNGHEGSESEETHSITQVAHMTNGHMVNGINDTDDVEEKLPSRTVSRTSLLEHGSKSVETSTDTLVEDINNLANTSKTISMQQYSTQCDNSISLAKDHIVLNTKLHPGVKASISTSTSDISDSHVWTGHMDLFSNGKHLSLDDVMLSLHTTVWEETPASNGLSSKISTTSSVESASSTQTTSCPTTPGVSDLKEPAWKSNHGVNRYLDVDGLTLVVDPVQQRLMQIEDDYKRKMNTLQRQLHTAKAALIKYTSGNNGRCGLDKDETNSLPESIESGPQSTNGAASDASWENVEEKDAQITKWVPDHVVTHCGGCSAEFWMANRKHHCRCCGQVFCWRCTNFSKPVPQQQLLIPSRVCFRCNSNLGHIDLNDVTVTE